MTNDESRAALVWAMRALREAWFNKVLRQYPHERATEPEGTEARRDRENAEIKARYDEQTEALIRGAFTSVAPCCPADLDITPNPQPPTPNP